MKIAVIGSGNMGRALATKALEYGYEVALTGRDLVKAKGVAEAISPDVISGDLAEVLRDAELVILATRYQDAIDLLESQSWQGKIIIDVTNPISADYMSLTLGHTTSAAEEIARRVPGASVVKAFNTVFAEAIYAATIAGRKISVFCAADDQEAKAKVMAFANALGFEGIDAGPLSNARYIEPMAELNIHLGYALKLGTGIGFSLLQKEIAV